MPDVCPVLDSVEALLADADEPVPMETSGGLVQFGWEKALGGYDDELAWWEEQAVRAQPLL